LSRSGDGGDRGRDIAAAVPVPLGVSAIAVHSFAVAYGLHGGIETGAFFVDSDRCA
jgi:hypothetical protein